MSRPYTGSKKRLQVGRPLMTERGEPSRLITRPAAPALAKLPPGGGWMEGETVGRSALSKASWRLLPLIGLGYGVAYMDRVNISFAAARMNQDLHFSATVYGLGGGLFFLAYAAFEVPSNLFLV